MRDDDTIRVLCELEERVVKDIKKSLKKDEIPAAEWHVLNEASEIIKNVRTTKAMDGAGYFEDTNDYERGMSYRYYPMEDNGYYNGRTRGSNGRYRSDGNNYNADQPSIAANLRNLMNNANSESERMAYKRLLDETERYGR